MIAPPAPLVNKEFTHGRKHTEELCITTETAPQFQIFKGVMYKDCPAGPLPLEPGIRGTPPYSGNWRHLGKMTQNNKNYVGYIHVSNQIFSLALKMALFPYLRSNSDMIVQQKKPSSVPGIKWEFCLLMSLVWQLQKIAI